MLKKIPIPRAKRYFDIVFTLILLIILGPLFILIMAVIFIGNILTGRFFNPLFYVEKRISQDKPFKFIKFNVFKPEVITKFRSNNEFIHTKKLEHDGKSLTLIGLILQKIYLDELPQLYNVLKGDLSLVGPRPVNPVNYKIILNQGNTTKAEIKAGLTGNFQSRKGEAGATQDKLDREYINFCLNNTAWKIIINDIKIILRTLVVIFKAKGI